MKKVLIFLLASMACIYAANAQSIIDADDQRNPNDFYVKVITTGKKAMPYPPVRKSDVVWENVIWRDIDLNEKFNQFFYFPADDEKQTQGRTNLVNLIVKAVQNGEIPAYEDDDMVKEYDPEEAMRQLAGDAYTKEVEKTDADGNQMWDEETGEALMETKTFTREFKKETAKKLHIKEKWYIDKQDTRQKVRILALSFDYLKENVNNEEVPATSFWIPMDDMRVRQVLVNANAYDENNDVKERSYDDIFIQRYFDSYIVRETNTQNRALEAYLTGEDAILQSQAIEDKIFDIESDMWEY